MHQTPDKSWKTLVWALAAAILVHGTVASIGWWNPIVDHHGSRQTQTALSAYWMNKGAPFLAYETPVMGPPWSIPFEFPLYQGMAALWSRSTSIPLEQSGRLIGLFFFYAGLLPVGWMIRRLRLPAVVFGLFAILYLASPLYLFWSRTFMIETTAMTLSLVFFCAVTVALLRPYRWLAWTTGTVSGVLAALVKVTTFACALLPVGLLFLLLFFRRGARIRPALYGLVPLVLPVLAGATWTRFSDAVKLQNPLQFITSSELAAYNFGTLSLRASKEFWIVMGDRMMRDLLGKAWPLLLLATVALAILTLRGRRWSFRPAGIGWLAACGFLVGPLVFANLYYIHDYYPCAAAAYLYLAMAVLWGIAWRDNRIPRRLCHGLLALLVVSNAWTYIRCYYPYLVPALEPMVNTAKFLKGAISPADVPIVYGCDWEPIIPYYSERKAIMDRMYRSAGSPQLINAVAALPAGQKIGAVVACNEALQEPFRVRVLDTVLHFGMSSQPAYDDGCCRVYLPASGRHGPAPRQALAAGAAWLHLPLLGATHQLPAFKKPGLELLNLVALTPDPSLLAPIEGPDGAAAILSNPGARLGLPVPVRATGVLLKYGIKDYAWKTGGAPAVTFEVYGVRGAEQTLLWSRSLDPTRQGSDRGPQKSEIHLPPSTTELVLATASAVQTPSQRAYWSAIEFR